MSDDGVIHWNSEYPTFTVQGAVDIRLYDVTDMRKPVLEQLNMTNDNGYMNLHLAPNLKSPIFVPVPNRPKNSTATIMYCFLVTVAGDDTVNKPNDPHFFIQDPPPLNETIDTTSTFSVAGPTYTTIATMTCLSTLIPSDTSNKQDSQDYRSAGLTSGAIAGISLGCMPILVAAGIALVYYRRWGTLLNTQPKAIKDINYEDGAPVGSRLNQDVQTGYVLLRMMHN